MLLNFTENVYDRFAAIWENSAGRGFQGVVLIWVFLGTLLMVELKRQLGTIGVFNSFFSDNHLMAIEMAFTVLLLFEAVGLVLSFVASVSVSVGKQFEILSLILLRDTFKEISHFQEPLVWEEVRSVLPAMTVSAVGALVIFVAIGIYFRCHHSMPAMKDGEDKQTFIRVKKGIAVILLCAFLWICGDNLVQVIVFGRPENIFQSFFTLLVFSDVLMVLISLRYCNSYLISFRNSAFAVATVLIRIALIAPIITGAIIGVGTVFFALGVVVSYNYFGADGSRNSGCQVTPDI